MPGKKKGDFHGGGFGSVGAMHGVGVDGLGEIGADGALVGLFGSVAPISSRFLAMAFALQALDHHRAGGHEETRSLKEGRASGTA